MNKREQNKIEIKNNITNAAEILFLEKGYKNTNIEHIAKHAGTTKRTLYKHFPSKLAIFMDVFDKYLHMMCWTVLDVARRKLQTKEKLILLFNEYIKFTAENEKFMRLFWFLDSNEFDGQLPQELIQKVNVANRATIDESVKMIKQGQNEGIVINCDPVLLLHLFSGVIKGVFLHASKERKFEIAELEPNALFQVAEKVFFHGFFTKES